MKKDSNATLCITYHVYADSTMSYYKILGIRLKITAGWQKASTLCINYHVLCGFL